MGIALNGLSVGPAREVPGLEGKLTSMSCREMANCKSDLSSPAPAAAIICGLKGLVDMLD